MSTKSAPSRSSDASASSAMIMLSSTSKARPLKVAAGAGCAVSGCCATRTWIGPVGFCTKFAGMRNSACTPANSYFACASPFRSNGIERSITVVPKPLRVGAGGQRAVFGGVRQQLVYDQRHGRERARIEQQVWPFQHHAVGFVAEI